MTFPTRHFSAGVTSGRRAWLRNPLAEAQMVAAPLAAIVDTIHQRLDQMNAEAADGAIFKRRCDIGRGRLTRIKRPPVIDDLHVEKTIRIDHFHLDIVTSVIGEGVGDDVGQRFIESEVKIKHEFLRNAVLYAEGFNRLRQARNFRQLVRHFDAQPMVVHALAAPSISSGTVPGKSAACAPHVILRCCRLHGRIACFGVRVERPSERRLLSTLNIMVKHALPKSPQPSRTAAKNHAHSLLQRSDGLIYYSGIACDAGWRRGNLAK